MGKLGKKARKFAKKNMQSVLKRKRKLKSVFKKRAANKKGGQAEAEEYELGYDKLEHSNGRNIRFDVGDASLDAIFGEDDSDMDDDDSGSDGYLSEGENSLDMDGFGGEINLEGTTIENKEIQSELANKKTKLYMLQEKDPEFCKFLESNLDCVKGNNDNEEYLEDDVTSHEDDEAIDDSDTKVALGKLLNDSATDYLYQLVKEQQNVPALLKLLNGYRAACHYRTESSDVLQDSRTCSKILMLMLLEGDSIFRKMLGLSSSNETSLGLTSTAKWNILKPLIKSYLRGTLFLLNEVDDSEILAFILSRLRASLLFFSAFHSLRLRLIKVSVHLWATGEGSLSLQSFHVIQDVATVFNSDCFDTCFIRAYKAFIGSCNLIEPELFNHIEFMKDSIVEICSQDMQKSLSKAVISLKQLSNILQLGLQTKQKEAVKKICSWQYANCIDLWVTFISANLCDYDLQSFSYLIIQIINGVALLFPGPRYLPLRVKCVQWLNKLSASSGIFIPIASLALDALEYIGKETKKRGVAFNIPSALKLPKHWLKSRNFQEQCVLSAIELLAVHFSQWSYHISFPELATFPLIRLRKFHETKNISENLRHTVKRFIDQVEQNVDYLQKKRDEVVFSPKDQQSVESFLQLEKSNTNTPFTQHYKSIIGRSSTSTLLMKRRGNPKKEAAPSCENHTLLNRL